MSKSTITVVALPDCGAGNNPEYLGLALHTGHYGSNDLPRPRKSALPDCERF